jgi:hypothetical protein
VPRLDGGTIGGRSALDGLLLALGTGLVVACGPAWRWLRAEGLGTLRTSASAGGQTGRGRHARPAWLTFATPEYFETMQIPVRDGRTFATEDRTGRPPVAVISEGLATRLFDGSAPGRPIAVRNERTPAPLEVVGASRASGTSDWTRRRATRSSLPWRRRHSAR